MSAATERSVLCYVVNCKNYRTKANRKKGITFHKFPNKYKLPEVYEKWASYCGREAPTTDNRRMCSVHFKESAIDRTGQIVRLREGAVPTVSTAQIRNRKKIARPLLLSAASPEEFSKTKGFTIDPTKKAPLSISRQRAVDHPYSVSSAPEMKNKVRGLEQKLEQMKSRLNNSLKREQRARRNIDRLEGKILDMILINRDLRTKLRSFEAVPVELFAKPAQDYTDTQRAIYQTIYLYSRKTYNYLRDVCRLSLPHPRTLRRWRGETEDEAACDEATLQDDNPELHEQRCVLLDGTILQNHVHIDTARLECEEINNTNQLPDEDVAEEVYISVCGTEEGMSSEETCLTPDIDSKESDSESGEDLVLNDHSYDFQTFTPLKHLRLL